MSTSFDIHSSTGSYKATVRSGLFDEVIREHADSTFLVDEFFAERMRAAGQKAIVLPAAEHSKSLDAIPEIIVELRKLGANRRTKLVAVGGGIVQDVACFIASIYMRGVEWDYVPTTLLAMVDSCIGGKSSINVGPYKNLVGTFHPPTSIWIDPALIGTLPVEARLSGLIEACKICYCRGSKSFQEYLATQPNSSMDAAQVEKIVILSLAAKKWFIEIDEFDKAERLLLNFGHTFGHALEGASDFRIAHGIGVGIGMLCAIELGKSMGRDYAGAPLLRELDMHVRELLRQSHGLASVLQDVSLADIIDRFQSDKKHGASHFSLIVVSETGAVELFRLPKDDATLALIKNAIQTVVGQLSQGTVTNGKGA